MGASGAERQRAYIDRLKSQARVGVEMADLAADVRRQMGERITDEDRARWLASPEGRDVAVAFATKALRVGEVMA